MEMQHNKPKNYSLTLFLLCAGYFMDFYDLTIMGVCYVDIFRDQFFMTDMQQIQKTYLLVSNAQTAGIFVGALCFGMLGDKLGRAKAIRYSILLYSLATLAAVYTHSLSLFLCLRFLAYVGLAAEFSTSTVLILELFSVKKAAIGTALLYSFGVMGGILATFMGGFSWQITFLFGGIVGVMLYIGRSKIQESEIYLNARRTEQASFGSLKTLWLNKIHRAQLLRYFFMILPYFALISLIFLFPNYVVEKSAIGSATRQILLGFFCGNIVSSLLSAVYMQYSDRPRYFIVWGIVLFGALMPLFSWITPSYLWLYSIGLGLIGGGYPILLTQQMGRDYPVHIRSLACNSLSALGRASNIGFNALLSYWIASPDNLRTQMWWIIGFVFLLAMVGYVSYQKNAFNTKEPTPASRNANIQV